MRSRTRLPPPVGTPAGSAGPATPSRPADPSGLPAVLTVLVLLVLSVLSGCSGGEAPTSPSGSASSKTPQKVLSPGTCWGDQQLAQSLGPDGFKAWVEEYAGGDTDLGESMRDDAAFASRIDCTKPHSLELYNVVKVTPSLAGQITSYADLLDQDSALYRRVRDQVNNRCMARSPYGVAQRKAGGLPVQLGPSLNVDGGLHVAWDPFPADLWTKGQHKFVCTFEQEKPGTLRFADLTTAKVPVSARVCLNTPGKYLPCNRKHQAEDIAEMILNTAIDKGQINGKKAVRKGSKGPYVALSDAEYAKLDKVCQTFLASVSTIKGGVSARAYPGAVSQWPTETGAYVASCFALKPFEPPPPIKGTVFNRS